MDYLTVFTVSICLCVVLNSANVLAQAERLSGKRQTTEITEQAKRLLESGKTDAAIELLNSAPKAASADPQVSRLRGLAYYQKRDYARAIDSVSAGLTPTSKGADDYPQAVQILGLSHYLLGHHREAIPNLEQTLHFRPESVEIAYALGVCYIQTRNLNKSRDAFARMFKISPSSAPAYLINAQMMVHQQFEELAEQELNRALALDPNLPQAYFLLGELAIFHADIERGITLLQKEIEINPAFAMAYYRLGEAYTRQLKLDEAIAPLQKAVWLNPNFSGPYIVLGKVYLKKSDLQNAEGMLRRATQMDPNNFSAHHLLAQVLQRANRLDEARREFELAEKLRTSADKDQ